MLVEVLRPPLARPWPAVRLDVLVLFAVVAFSLANIPYLEAWPTAHNDEARQMNAFWVASGAQPGARPMDPEFGPDPLYKGGLQGLSVGLWFRVVGLGLFEARLVSLAWGGLLLFAAFLVGRRLYGPAAGVLAALFLALTRPFLLASHMLRPDVVLAAMLALSAYLALRGVQERGAWTNLGAGLLLGLALDVHLNAIAFMPLIALIYIVCLPAFWRARALHLFAAGLAVGTIYYLLARIVSDPAQFAASSSYWIGVDKRPPVLSGDLPGMVAAELGRFREYFTEDRRFELFVIGGGLAVAAWRAIRQRHRDPILLGLGAALLIFIALVSSKSEFYLILYYTWLVLLLAGSLTWLASRAHRFQTPLLLLAAVVAPFVFGVPDNYEDVSTAASNYSERGYYAVVEEIRAVIPPGASILGPPLFWIGLNDHPYTDYYVWERLRSEKRERFASYVARLKPDVVVLDAKSRHQVSINSPGFLESNGALLKSVTHVGFDRIEVWKLS